MDSAIPLNELELLFLKSLIKTEENNPKGFRKNQAINDFLTNHFEDYINRSQKTANKPTRETVRKNAYALFKVIINIGIINTDESKKGGFAIDQDAFKPYLKKQSKPNPKTFHKRALGMTERYLMNEKNRLDKAKIRARAFKKGIPTSKNYIEMSDKELQKEFDAYVWELEKMFKKNKYFVLDSLSPIIDNIKKFK